MRVRFADCGFLCICEKSEDAKNVRNTQKSIKYPEKTIFFFLSTFLSPSFIYKKHEFARKSASLATWRSWEFLVNVWKTERRSLENCLELARLIFSFWGTRVSIREWKAIVESFFTDERQRDSLRVPIVPRTRAAFKHHSLTELSTGETNAGSSQSVHSLFHSFDKLWIFFFFFPPSSESPSPIRNTHLVAHTPTHFNFSIDTPDTRAVDTYCFPSFIFRDKRMFLFDSTFVFPIFRTPARQSGLNCPTVD